MIQQAKTRTMHKISCLLILLAVLAGCARKQKDPGSKPAIPVKVAEVQSQEVEEVLQYSGNILPYKIVKFGFMDAGKVKAVHVKEGQYVHEGDLIAELDATDYRFALEAAKAQYEEARSEYKRLKTLYEKGSLTQSDYDRIKAMHREAKADYEYKQKQLNDTKLYAPADGWIAVEGIEPGEILPQGYPVFGLVHTEKVFAEAAIPENEIALIKPEMKINVKVPSLPDTIIEAEISRIEPVADPYARAFPVKATILNKDYLLKPGMIAMVEIPTTEKIAQISIPPNAVVRDANGQTYVFVLEEDQVHKTRVGTGHASKSGVLITSGLSGGEKIVVEGAEQLYEKAKVRVTK